MTACYVYRSLLALGYCSNSFCESTINNILNRMGYSLKKVQKTKPLKRISATDSIFENIKKCSESASNCSKTLRISIDVKDKVKVGELSRKGYHRKLHAVKALDKDQKWDAVLVPVGIVEVESGESTILYGNSLETSDMIMDCLEEWANLNAEKLKTYQHIQINLDNGPHNSSSRTQFMYRIVNWADTLHKTIELVYYPPYHSKYNPIERVWAALENYWNGTLLTTVEKVLATTKQMTWRQIHPRVVLIDKIYEKGVKRSKNEMIEIKKRLTLNPIVPKWHVIIKPN